MAAHPELSVVTGSWQWGHVLLVEGTGDPSLVNTGLSQVQDTLIILQSRLNLGSLHTELNTNLFYECQL